MKKIKDFIKNYHPSKLICIAYFLIPIVVCILQTLKVDNDFWFLINHGRYILSNGFPTIEPFTIHSNMAFMIQQWLTDVIYYRIYDWFGIIGIIILVSIVNIGIIFVLYKLCMLLSKGKVRLSVLLTVIADTLLSLSFIVARPQIFTYLILLLALYFLEKYIEKDNGKYLIVLPFLSLLLINFHSSMWFMLIAFMIPYLIDAFKFKTGVLEGEGYRKKPLLIALLFVILAGFINPYGLESIKYIFTSYGNSYINQYVGEMIAPLIKTPLGMIVYITIFGVLFTYIFHKKGHLKLRYLCLFLGTCFLVLTSMKGFAFFIIAAIVPLSYYLQDLFLADSRNIKKLFINNWKQYTVIYLVLIIVTSGLTIACANPRLLPYNSEATKYLKERYNEKEMVLYTNYEDGSYAEWLGLKPYIDPRAEVFLKANNGQKDIFQEYCEVQLRKIKPEEFIKIYSFTHFIVSEEDTLYEYLKEHEESYSEIYRDEYRHIFARVE